MSSTMIEPGRELEQRALSLPEKARSIVIRDQPTYTLAATTLQDVVAIRKQITEYHKPLKEKAHQAHQAICDAEAGMLKPIADAEAILKRGIGTWHAEQSRIEEEARRKAEEEARKAQEVERQRQALELEKARLAAEQASLAAATEAEAAGASKEAVDAILEQPDAVVEEMRAVMEQPIVAPAIPLAPAYERAIGLSIAKTYKAEVFDLKALAAGIGGGLWPVNLIEANQPALNAMARATKGTIKIPGVRFVEDSTVRSGGRR